MGSEDNTGATDEPVPPMRFYGQRFGQPNVGGRACWGEEIVEHAFGYAIEVGADRHPHDGRERVCYIMVSNTATGRSVPVGMVFFGGDCRQTGADMSSIYAAVQAGIMPDDARAVAFIESYPEKLPILDAIQMQREYPTQFPWAFRGFDAAAISPGEVEVI